MSDYEDPNLRTIIQLALNLHPELFKVFRAEIDSPAKFVLFLSLCIEEAVFHLTKSRLLARGPIKVEAGLRLFSELAVLLFSNSKIPAHLFAQLKNYPPDLVREMIEATILGSRYSRQLQRRPLFRWCF